MKVNVSVGKVSKMCIVCGSSMLSILFIFQMINVNLRTGVHFQMINLNLRTGVHVQRFLLEVSQLRICLYCLLS